jgi:hypothetical protein
MASPLQVDTQFQQINPVQWQKLFELAQELNFAQHRTDLFAGQVLTYRKNIELLILLCATAVLNCFY